MASARILIVEDDGITASHIQACLTKAGYAVCGVAASGELAIQRAAATRPDLALMDIYLQGKMNGLEAAAHLRARLDIPVIYLTAFADEATLQQAKLTDAYAYITKPFDEQDLRTAIEMALYKHKLDRELRESRQWLAATLNSIGDAVIATDMHGCVKLMNPVAEALTGWPQGEALGQDLMAVFQVISEETRQPVENPVARALREGVIVGLANHSLLVARDGREIPIADSAAPIKDDAGAVTGVVLIFRDVTEKRRAERELAESEQRLRDVIDAAPFGAHLYELRPDGSLIFAGSNRSADAILGLDHRQFHGQPIEAAFPGLAGTPIPDAYRRVAAAGEKYDDEQVVYDAQGISGAFEIHAFQTAPNRMAVFFRDVTERRRAEEELRRASREWESIFQAIGQPTLILDPHHNVLAVNRATVQATGQEAGELVGKKCYEVLHAGGQPAECCPLQQLLTSRHLETVEMEIQALAGLFLVSCTPVFDQAGRLEKIIHIATDITERRRAEESLKRSAATLQSIFRAAPVGIGLVSNRLLLQVNERICEMTGYAREELVGQSARLLYPTDEDFEYVGREKYKQIGERGTGTVETRWRRKDGAILDILLSSTPLDPADLAAGVTFTALDITERKRAQDALRKERDLVARMIETTPAGIVLVGRDGQITFANAYAEQILGLTINEMAQRAYNAPEWRITDYAGHPFPEDNLPFVQVKATGRPVYDVRHAIEWPDGRRVLLSINAAPLFDAAGQFDGMVAALSDITEQMKAEAALRSSEDKFSRAFRTSPDSVNINRLSDGLFLEINQGFTALTGYTAQDVQGKTSKDIDIWADPQDRARLVQGLRERGEVRNLEAPFRLKDGRILTGLMSATLIEINGEKCILSITRDISERKQMEDLARIQRDIAITLSRAGGLIDALDQVLKTVLQAPGLDSGAIYLVDPRAGDLCMAAHAGLSPQFVERVGRYGADAPQTRLVMAGKPIYQKYAELLPASRDDVRRNEGLRALGVVPVQYEGRVIAAINVASHAQDAIPAATCRVIETVAAQVGGALARLEAEQALSASEERYRRRSEQLQALYDISLRLNAQLDVAELLRLIVNQAVKLLGASTGCVYTYERRRGELVLSVGVGHWAGFVGRALQPGEGVSGLVFNKRHALVIEDYDAWPGRIAAFAEGGAFKAILAVPLIGAAEVLGVLDVGGDERKLAFDQDDVRLAELFAAQAAVALESARLHAEVTRRAQELAALNQAGQAITSTLNRDEMLRVVMDRVKTLLEAEGASVLAYDPEFDDLTFIAAAGPSADALVGKRMPAADGLAGWVAQNKRAAWSGDARSDARFYAGIDAMTGMLTRSLAAAPLLRNERVVGVVEAVNKVDGTFDEHDVEMLEIIAGSIVTALENVRLYDAERDQRRLAETLRDVGAALASTLDVDAVLDCILEQTGRVAPHDAVNIMLIEQETARVARARGYEKFGAQDYVKNVVYRVADLPHLRRMLETGQPLVVSDSRADPDWVLHPEMAWLRSYAAAPIRLKNEVVGFLNVDSASPGFFNWTHAERLSMLANQAALALENARLFSSLDQEKERLELLYYLSRKLSETLDVRQVAYRALDGLCSITGALYGVVWVREGDVLQSVALVGYNAPPDAVYRLPLGQGLAGWAAAHREPVVAPDVTRDERWQAEPGLEEMIRSAFCAPLISGDELVGVLTVGSVRQAFFGPDVCRLVESAAGPVAMAMANARLFQKEREQFARLQQSQAQLIHAEKMSALGQLAASIAHEINNPLQAVQGNLELSLEELESAGQPDVVKDYLRTAESEIERLAGIIRRMRDFYRMAREEMQPTDIHDALESMLLLCGKRLQHAHVTVERDWASNLPLVRANADHLKQVFLNLVLNAIDAMSARGGTLRVSTALDQLQMAGGALRPAVRIEFGDTGEGMPPEVMAHLFEPFYTTKKTGSGLGLSISYGIVEAHGGRLTAVSRVGEGTTFTLVLPVEQA